MLAPAFAILFPNPCSFKVSLAPENKNLTKETNHV
jgi:hypothetical protein